jgi:hypothetical protein
MKKLLKNPNSRNTSPVSLNPMLPTMQTNPNLIELHIDIHDILPGNSLLPNPNPLLANLDIPKTDRQTRFKSSNSLRQKASLHLFLNNITKRLNARLAFKYNSFAIRTLKRIFPTIKLYFTSFMLFIRIRNNI